MAGETESKFGGLWKQFAIGTLAVDALKKGFGLLKDFVGDSITAAMDSETAQKNLETALATTGRTVSAMLPDLTNFANEIMRQTTVDDEATKGALALMVQLTNLDEQGLKAATKGAIGLAKVFNVDLETATRIVAKAMGGEMDLLGKYIPQVRNLSSEHEKHALVMQQLGLWYRRATAETNTFSGQLSQLKNWWSEVKEEIGRAITENEGINKLIEELKNKIITLIESGKLKEWVDNLSKAIQDATPSLEKLLGFIFKITEGAAIAGPELMKMMREELLYRLETAREKMAALNKETGDYDIAIASLTSTLYGHDVILKKIGETNEDIKKPINETGIAIGSLNAELEKANKKKYQEYLDRLKEAFKVVIPEVVILDKTLGIMVGGNLQKLIDKLPEAKDNVYGLKDSFPALLKENLTTNEKMAAGIIGFGKTWIDEHGKIIRSTNESTKTIHDYFAGLYNDIAQGWGNTIQKWMEGGTTFKNFIKAIFNDIKASFFRMVGEMIAEWVINLIKPMTKEIDGAKVKISTSLDDLAKEFHTSAGNMVASFGFILIAATGFFGFIQSQKEKNAEVYKAELDWLDKIKEAWLAAGKSLKDYYDWVIKLGEIEESWMVAPKKGLGERPERKRPRLDLLGGQFGLDTMTYRPTLFMSSENYRPERVTIVPSQQNFNISSGTIRVILEAHGRVLAETIAPYMPEITKDGRMKIHTNALVSH